MADQAPTTSDATAADAAPTEAKPAAPGAGVAPNAAAVTPDAARAPAKRTAKKAPATARTAKKAAPASGPDRPADTTTADTTAADTAPAAASAPPKKAPVKRAPARQNAAAAPVTPATPAATAAATAPAGTTAPVSDPAAEPAVEVAADSSDAAAAAQVTSPAFAVLAAEPYISLTTFRKSGTPVPTPVWAAPDGGTLLVWTGANSGKVKRIRHTPGVTVAPCDRQGRLLGDPVPATARVLGIDDLSRVKAAMTEKYGWQFRMSALGAALGQALRIAPHGQIALEITVD